MAAIALSLAPIFLLILLGTLLKARRFVPDDFWMPAERLTYFVTFPALLASNLARADLSGLPWPPIAGVMIGATVLAGALMLSLRRVVAADAAAFTSAFQGSIRPNTYVGLAGAAALYGTEGMTVTAICIAAVVPLVNLLAVTVLTRMVPGRAGPGPLAVVRGVVTNPLIAACAVGIAANVAGIGLPPVIGPLLEILGRAALPIGLLAVGAGLALESLKGATRPLVSCSAIKLLALPALAALGGWVFGLPAATTGVMVLYAALPCSASSYVLARHMGGDAPLMASIITVQTLVSMATIPLAMSAYAAFAS